MPESTPEVRRAGTSRTPGRRLQLQWPVIRVRPGERERLALVEQQIEEHGARLARHGEWLAAQDEAWTAWRDARTGRLANLRLVKQ
jgi:hypothetical protein